MNNQSVVYKYNVNPGLTTLSLPRGSRILTVDFQEDMWNKEFASIYLWAQVPVNYTESELRFVRLVGTGEFFEDGRYIGTTQRNGMVFHLFEVANA